MRVLVLGGTGMLGRAVAAYGRRRGRQVLALSRAQADLTDPSRLAFWVDDFAPEVVVNCAAFTQVDACEERREHAHRVNGEALAAVVAAASRRDAYLIQVSSDYVFDGRAREPYGEDAATAPASVYGASKLAGETLALAYRRALVLRTSWLFGPGGPSFVDTIRRLVLSGEQPLRVVDDQVGAPTYTPYLARAIWELAALQPSGIVHYQNRQPVSWYGFAVEIAAALRPGTEIEPVPTSAFARPAPRPAYSVLDTGRFEALVKRRVEPWLAGLTGYLGGDP